MVHRHPPEANTERHRPAVDSPGDHDHPAPDGVGVTPASFTEPLRGVLWVIPLNTVIPLAVILVVVVIGLGWIARGRRQKR